MRQQVNLFQDVLLEKKPPLQARIILAAVSLCLVVLLVLSLFLAWQQRSFEANRSELQVTLQQKAAEIQTLHQQYPSRKSDPRVASDLEQLKQELKGRKPLLDYLDRIEPGRTKGFSPVIEGFARYPYKGVWLTGMRFNALEQQVLLAGSAIRSELVPGYLKHLGDKQVLRGQNFASLKLVRLKESARQVDFRLESEFGAADE